MEKDAEVVPLAPPVAKFGARHVQTLLMALASFQIYALRISLSVAIVAMTAMDRENVAIQGSNETDPDSSTVEPAYPMYDWDERTQGLVLSSFFWGYVITQVPAGVLTQRFGAHRFLAGAVFTTSAMCVLLPPFAYLGGWGLVCANRMLQGVAQGFVYPAIFTMMGLWIPTEERGRLSAFVLGAQNMGPVLATPLAGWLAAYYGWPSIFYYFGVLGVALSAVIFVYGADSPAAHKTIDGEERAYIETSLGGRAEKFPTPWRAILTSGPAWATIMTMALQGGVFLTFLTKIPTYLSSVLNFNIKDNGVLTAAPYLVAWLLSFVFSWSCDWLVKKNYLNVTQARKVFNSISHVGSGVMMIFLGYCTDVTLSVVLLTLSIGLMAGSYPGAQANIIDLAPNSSGSVFAISNCLSAQLGVAGPIIISFIVTEKGSVTQWRVWYFLCSAIMFLSNLHFVVCGSAQVQPWNFPPKTRKEKNENERDFSDTGEKTVPGDV